MRRSNATSPVAKAINKEYLMALWILKVSLENFHNKRQVKVPPLAAASHRSHFGEGVCVLTMPLAKKMYVKPPGKKAKE